MKVRYEFDELWEFRERLENFAKFNEFMKQATQELAKVLHQMLMTYTPFKTGKLWNGWNSNENWSYIVRQEKNGFSVKLTNDVEYALSVNDGHYSHNQYNKGGEPYVVKNRTPKIYTISEANKDDTFVFGHFFVEKSVVETESKMEEAIYPVLEKWWSWCCSGK